MLYHTLKILNPSCWRYSDNLRIISLKPAGVTIIPRVELLNKNDGLPEMRHFKLRFENDILIAEQGYGGVNCLALLSTKQCRIYPQEAEVVFVHGNSGIRTMFPNLSTHDGQGNYLQIHIPSIVGISLKPGGSFLHMSGNGLDIVKFNGKNIASHPLVS